MGRDGPNISVACIQMRSGADQDKNIRELSDLVREASASGAHYVQTPEMTGVVQKRKNALFAQIQPDDDNPVFAAASDLALELGIWLHIGSTAIALGNGKAANRAALFAPTGERVAHYDKIHMFDVDLDNGESWRESAIYRAGSKAVLIEGGPTNIGMAICYDLRFPDLFRQQARQGAVMLTCPSCFTRQTGEVHWHVLLRARAIENGAYMIAAAQGGLHEDGRQSFGHSLIVDPWGQIVAELDHDEPGILLASIEPKCAEMARRKIPSLNSYPDYELEISRLAENHSANSGAAKELT